MVLVASAFSAHCGTSQRGTAEQHSSCLKRSLKQEFPQQPQGPYGLYSMVFEASSSAVARSMILKGPSATRRMLCDNTGSSTGTSVFNYGSNWQLVGSRTNLKMSENPVVGVLHLAVSDSEGQSMLNRMYPRKTMITIANMGIPIARYLSTLDPQGHRRRLL